MTFVSWRGARLLKIEIADGKLVVPDRPTIPYIEGDGIGPDIWKATQTVVDAAVDTTYGSARQIEWIELLAGEKAYRLRGTWLPQDTIDEIRNYVVAIKGPLTTPVGTGFRSLNVTLRQELDLYSCIRPVRWVVGVPAPVLHPEKVDVVIFRENTEDVYAGLEWEEGSKEAELLRRFLQERLNAYIPEDAGIGLKYLSETGTRRIMRKALDYAIKNGRKSVTIVHKGNIMKYTEGQFRQWCYDLAEQEFGQFVIRESELPQTFSSDLGDKIILKDRIADNMFQQVLLRSDEYDVIVAPNLNGDYLSDAMAAQVGGLGLAPGANIGDYLAVFEATHGTAPKYAGLDLANPCSLILSAAMMLKYIGWNEAAELIEKALEKTVAEGTVTQDLARQMTDGRTAKTSEFAGAIVRNMAGVAR